MFSLSRQEIDSIVNAIDHRRGLVLSSTYEFPGRYTKWCFGFRDPPLVLESRAHDFSIRALNDRGCVLLPAIAKSLDQPAIIKNLNAASRQIDGSVHTFPHTFSEELRSGQASVFSVLRTLIRTFCCEDGHLGFYGAFGYDPVFQFETIRQTLDRQDDQRDIEYFGGSLGVLDRPAHGTRSSVHVLGGQLLAGLPTPISAGRYHSLYANLASIPQGLRVTAKTDEGVVMAIEHASMPIAAVQFHPESLLTSCTLLEYRSSRTPCVGWERAATTRRNHRW